MSSAEDREALAERLARGDAFKSITADDLEPTDFAGLSHTHIRLKKRGLVLRILTGAQPGSDSGVALAYESACFERAWPSGVTPRKCGRLAPGPGAPYGALIVEEIVGRPPRLPDDLSAIAQSLARLHALRKPQAGSRAPLIEHDDPVEAIVALARTRRPYLERCGAEPETVEMIAAEIDAASEFAAAVIEAPHPARLALADAHPGNFVIDQSGRAVAVDLEKALYGSPAADLAHASLLPTARWDARVTGEIDADAVAQFYQAYLDALDELGAPRLARAVRTWCAPMRRLVWLRVVTWFAEWMARVADPATGERLRRAAPSAFNDAVNAAQAALSPQAVAAGRREWTSAALPGG